MLMLIYAQGVNSQTQNVGTLGSLSGRIIILPSNEPAIANITIYRVERGRGY